MTHCMYVIRISIMHIFQNALRASAAKSQRAHESGHMLHAHLIRLFVHNCGCNTHFRQRAPAAANRLLISHFVIFWSIRSCGKFIPVNQLILNKSYIKFRVGIMVLWYLYKLWINNQLEFINNFKYSMVLVIN